MREIGRAWRRAIAADSLGEEIADEDVRLIKCLPCHYAGMSSLTGSISAGFQWNAGNNLVGAVYNQITNGGNILKRLNLTTANANNTAGGADEVFSFQQGISAGSSATINLRAMTNLLGQANTAIARFKGYMNRLLSATDDATISPAPNSTSTCLITNNGNIAVPNALDFGQSGSGLSVTIVVFANNAINTVSISTNGSGYAPLSTSLIFALNQIGGSGGTISGNINAAGNISAITLLQAGAGYTNATLNTTLVGQYPLSTGDAHVHLDASNLGIPVNTASQNYQIINQDAAHAITAEVSFFGGTT
jgi:hypothetical protein